MKAGSSRARSGWLTANTNLRRLWERPALSDEIRQRLAEEAVGWVLMPVLALNLFGVIVVLATVGLSQPTRFIPILSFAIPCLFVYRLKLARRWLPAAGVLCAAATLHVVSGVLFNGVRAPAYGLGVLLLMLIVTLFGLRWASLSALLLVAVGAARLHLDAHGIPSGAPPPTAALTYCLYVGIFALTLALVGGPHLLLSEALNTAQRERQQADQARRAEATSELAFHAVFDQASVALALLSADGRIAQLNARAAAFLGQRQASLIGCPLTIAASWTDPQRELVERALAKAARGQGSRHELDIPQSRSSPAVFQLTFSPFLVADGGVEHVLVEIVDVSDLVETRSMLAQARRLESLGKLSGGVAHDLNNMFAAILGGCELVKIARGDVRKIEDHVTLIQASVQRGSTLTRQLLAFGRKDRWNSEQLEASQLVNEVARLLERTLHKNIDLILSGSSEQRCFVRADSAALEHALLNLALNAQDAMPDGGTLTISCRREQLDQSECGRRRLPLQPGAYVVVSVEDTGTGLSDDVKEHMFEPFYTTKGPGEGAGLGLAAVHGTMSAHHGAVVVHSQLGVGTRFDLYFPAAASGPIAAPAERPEPKLPTGLAARVLLADDEALPRNAIAAILAAAGCEVHALADGAALIHALKAGRSADIIVTDLAMPGLGGVNLVQTIEALRPECPLLLITGFTGDDVADACPAGGTRRLLRKPFLRAELITACAELLAQGKRRSRSTFEARHTTGPYQP